VATTTIAALVPSLQPLLLLLLLPRTNVSVIHCELQEDVRPLRVRVWQCHDHA
jgi:hypothetical protein